MFVAAGLTTQDRNQAQAIVNHLSNPAFMTDTDDRVIKLIKRLVQAHDEVLFELDKLRTKQE